MVVVARGRPHLFTGRDAEVGRFELRMRSRRRQRGVSKHAAGRSCLMFVPACCFFLLLRFFDVSILTTTGYMSSCCTVQSYRGATSSHPSSILVEKAQREGRQEKKRFEKKQTPIDQTSPCLWFMGGKIYLKKTSSGSLWCHTSLSRPPTGGGRGLVEREFKPNALWFENIDLKQGPDRPFVRRPVAHSPLARSLLVARDIAHVTRSDTMAQNL